MRTIDEFTIAKAGGAGFALSALNPKNLLLTAAAALEVAEGGSRRAGKSRFCSASSSSHPPVC
jgi:hypothetical protein